ncbi:MAG TPA: spore coat protein U domain-containing protein [Alphaproteobacteria bacterium]|nr:spore coat protein U domain-containing protein [Alphaproteobacteria bacterium]
MTIKIRTLLPLVLIMGLANGPAGAACDLGFQRLRPVNWRPGHSHTYDPFDPEQRVQNETLTVRHRGEACRYFVTFSQGRANSYERAMFRRGESLEYNLYRNATLDTPLKDRPEAQSNEVLQGRFGSERDGWRRGRGRKRGRRIQRLDYFMSIAPLQIVSPGVYRDTVRVRLYEGTPSHPVRRDERTLTVTTLVQAAVQVSIGETGAAFDPRRTQEKLDFGELEKGEKAYADLMVRANTGYYIIISSRNRGRLRHDRRRRNTVGYRFEFDGTRINLRRRRVWLRFAAGGTALGSSRHPMAVTIGDVANAPAGPYSDTMTFTVRAR